MTICLTWVLHAYQSAINQYTLLGHYTSNHV